MRELRSDEYAASPPQMKRRAWSLDDLLICVDPGFVDATVAVVLDKRTGQLVDLVPGDRVVCDLWGAKETLTVERVDNHAVYAKNYYVPLRLVMYKIIT